MMFAIGLVLFAFGQLVRWIDTRDPIIKYFDPMRLIDYPALVAWIVGPLLMLASLVQFAWRHLA